MHSNWEARNEDKHGKDPATKEEAAKKLAYDKTKDWYEKRQLIMPNDRHHFYDSLEQHMEFETTSRSMNQWLSTWVPLFEESMKEFAELST